MKITSGFNIYNQDYKDFIKENKVGYLNGPKIDAIISDPPYVPKTVTRNKKVYRFPFDEDDHKEMAEILKQVKGNVVLSGYPSDLYDSLYVKWSISSKITTSSAGTQKSEMLWIKRDQLTLF